MDESRLPKLRRVTLQVVRNASQEGGLLQKGLFTMAVARKQISESMGFGENGLDDKPWKDKVKVLVQEALEKVAEEASASGSEDDIQHQPHLDSEAKRGKSSNHRKNGSPPTAGSSRQTPRPSMEPVEVSDSGSSFTKLMKKRDNDKKSKTKSDDKKAGSTFKSSAKDMHQKGKKVKAREDSPEMVDSGSEGEEESRAAAIADQSESEMSSVYDVAPTRKRSKKSSSGAAGKTSKSTRKSGEISGSEEERSKQAGKASGKRKKKDPNEGLSPDEAKVADLKRIVVACGVRRQWSKEFADCKTIRDQRWKLEFMLRNLGMQGQPSIGKAKAIKEKRELAAELNDVKEFEATRGVSGDRPMRSKKGRIVESVTSGSGEESDEPKEVSALDAVMDFLGDDSGSD